MVEEVFSTKASMSFDEYKKFIREESSEMFMSVSMVLLLSAHDLASHALTMLK